MPIFLAQVKSCDVTTTLFAHAETTTLSGGNVYYLLKFSTPADGPATILSKSALSGRREMGRWVYSLNGIVSVQASTWTVTYRALKTSSYVIAHCDVSIFIMKNDNTVRATIATNVANSPNMASTSVWETLRGTYSFPGYTVVDQTDYLEVIYYIEVTRSSSGKYVRLLVDDGTLSLDDQTKIENVFFTYPNAAPIASFTFSPSDPLIYEDVTFDASASYDSDGTIVSYKWDFGDGNITTVTNPIITHIYTTATSTVNYTVTLTVTDNGGVTGSATQIVPVTNPAILKISLPAGTYVGDNPDKWLDECWFLQFEALSGTFTLRINNTSCSRTSYDTHLIVALNDVGYNNLVSLTVNSVSIPKTAFRNGSPRPYNLYTWPSGDVYPTWFNDTYVNLGTVLPKGYVQATVLVTFSSAAGARIHFDAYGCVCSVPPKPTCQGKVTHNPLSEDSTVEFTPPPIQQYYLTVRTDPPDVEPISGEGWYDEGTNVVLTASDYVPVSEGVRYMFDYWDVDGTLEPGNPITVTMDANHTATAHYVMQYYLTVTSPFGTTNEGWYDGNTIVHASLDAGEIDQGNGTRRIFTHWSGDASGTNYAQSDNITMNEPKNAIANWKTLYRFIIRTSGLGTKVTNVYNGSIVLGTATDATPFVDWFNQGAPIDLDIDSPIYGSPTRYVFTQWSGDASGSNRPLSFTVNAPYDITAKYKTQHKVTFTYTGLDNSASSAVVTVNSVPKMFGDLPYEDWYDENSVINYFYSNVSSSVAGKRFILTGVTGPTSPITVTGPNTVTGHYKTQHLLTFTQTKLDSTATGAVVTVDGNAKEYANLPYSDWFDSNSYVDYSYNDIVSSTEAGKRFKLVDVTGPASPIFVTDSATVTGNYKTQYEITFDQTGVGTDFTGTVVTIDGIDYTVNELPTEPAFWWDNCSSHDFSFASPLSVDGKKYVWESTSGLSNLQSGTLHVETSGSVVGSYVEHNSITFDQTGVGTDFTGPIVIIDGTPYSTLPVSFQWEVGSVHSFAFQSPLVVNGKQYVWTSTTGLSDKQSDNNFIVTTFGSIVGHYKTQYYLTLATNPPGVTSPSGANWYDANTYAPISTAEFVPIVPGSSRYRFNGWTTTDMSEIVNPSSPSTTVKMDKAKTVTANYVVQCYFAVYSPSSSPPLGGPIPPPPGGFYDNETLITASVTSPWPGTAGTQYVCTGWIGTGSVPLSGTGTTVTFTITEPSSIEWKWKTQYYLTVRTSPSGITTIPGEGWYDDSTSVPLTAPVVAGHDFLYWDVDGTSQGHQVTIITVHMDAPHTATAHYMPKTAIVGGHSILLTQPAEASPLLGYATILAIFSAVITMIRRKRK